MALVAMLYSVYAIYASGKDAVLGGMLVMGIGFVIWGFIAPRFTQPATQRQRARPCRRGLCSAHVAAFAIAFLAALASHAGARSAAPAAPAGTLDRVKQAGKLKLGYRTDARPFSYRDESGKAAGYSVALCEKIAEQVKAELGLSSLAVEWVPVTLEDRFRAVQQGKVDLLCGADTATLTRRKDVSFSIPIFPSGIGAILRADASRRAARRPGRKAAVGTDLACAPARILEGKTFSVVSGTTSESWLAGRLDKFQITAKVVPVESYEAGVRRVLDRGSDVFFGDRAILLDVAKRSPSARDLTSSIASSPTSPWRLHSLAATRTFVWSWIGLEPALRIRGVRRLLREVVRETRSRRAQLLPLERAAGVSKRSK